MEKIINELFPHLNKELPDHIKKTYPDFKILCSVIKCRPPRHKYFEYILDMGRINIERVFSGESFRDKNPLFVFPERWMSIQEQRSFVNSICKHKDAKTFESVLIVTSSPIIISDFYREQLVILTFDDDKIIY